MIKKIITCLFLLATVGCEGLLDDPKKKAFAKEYENELNWLLEYATTHGAKRAGEGMDTWNSRFLFEGLIEARIKQGDTKFHLGNYIKYSNKNFQILEGYAQGVVTLDNGSQKNFIGLTLPVKGPNQEDLEITLSVFKTE
ncbi:MAG: hypothetical protein AAF492_09030 [Verrucomicrobiota bacterium]